MPRATIFLVQRDKVLKLDEYRPAYSLGEALSIMRDGRGSHFDPAILDIFLDSMDDVLAIKSAES